MKWYLFWLQSWCRPWGPVLTKLPKLAHIHLPQPRAMMMIQQVVPSIFFASLNWAPRIVKRKIKAKIKAVTARICWMLFRIKLLGMMICIRDFGLVAINGANHKSKLKWRHNETRLGNYDLNKETSEIQINS